MFLVFSERVVELIIDIFNFVSLIMNNIIIVNNRFYAFFVIHFKKIK